MRERPRVLVVEDDDDTRALFQNFLEYEGCDVQAAKHPDLVQNLAECTFVLMDVQFGSELPLGLEWIASRRQSGELRSDARVVFTTGFSADRLSVSAGDGVLPKPIELTALRKLLPKLERESEVEDEHV